jgi:hypothetical protein
MALISSKVIVKGFRKCCISVRMGGREDGGEAGNAGSECETEDGNCKDTEAETDNRDGDRLNLVELNKG